MSAAPFIFVGVLVLLSAHAVRLFIELGASQ